MSSAIEIVKNLIRRKCWDSKILVEQIGTTDSLRVRRRGPGRDFIREDVIHEFDEDSLDEKLLSEIEIKISIFLNKLK